MQVAIDTGIPTRISYGFLSGFCSGIALKKVGKAVSVVLGTCVCWRYVRYAPAATSTRGANFARRSLLYIDCMKKAFSFSTALHTIQLQASVL